MCITEGKITHEDNSKFGCYLMIGEAYKHKADREKNIAGRCQGTAKRSEVHC